MKPIVLIAGGTGFVDLPTGKSPGVLSSAEIYDPASGTFSGAGHLNQPRQVHLKAVSERHRARRPVSAEGLGLGAGGVLFDDADKGAAHDDAVGDGANSADVVGRRDAESHRQRKFGHPAHGRHQGRDAIGDARPFAGDTGSRNQVEETG